MTGGRLDQGCAYVARQRKQGRSDEQIRRSLSASGWKETDMEELLRPPTLPSRRARSSGGAVGARPRRGLVELMPEEDLPHRSSPDGGHDAPQKAVVEPSEPRRARPAEIAAAVVIVDLWSALAVLFIAVRMRQGQGGGIAPTLGLTVIAVYLGVIVIGHFVWNGCRWAHTALVALMGLTAFGGGDLVLLVLIAGSVPAAGLQFLVAILVLVLLLGGRARGYCSR